ncbi:Cell division inhibitor [Dissulfuribacter thermophilus]|uniref:Cell division inhibitor n=1 Tax=Dissulfuribacter thermophilus TaxID=1156395 RepID=A0A1B9F391_9BACT|nr:TIGR01777 family oxidoreductase [Dissulfuribacter thermophilus]OCC14285.1 Cell division inhibitor [Dissulfuribacter thermophilus]
MKIAITGASGFIGSHLRRRFKDHRVIKRDDSIDDISKKLEGIDCLINLAGAPIIKRWTDEYKKTLWNSRIGTTKKLVAAIEKKAPRIFISVSAVGIYPDSKECDEDCVGTSEDFLGMLASQWEKEAQKAQCPTAIFRFGMVLGKDGGALKKMLLPFKLGLGGPIGSGSMVMSWIHIDDLINAISFVIERGLTGIFNGVSPNPVTNKEFSKALGQALNRPAIIPIPIFFLKILYGDASVVLTASKIVYPKRLLQEGFRFEYPAIQEALTDLIANQ